jgi:hypothetical protein
MKFLDDKYKKILIDKKIIQSTFESQILNEHREGSKIQIKTLFGNPIVTGFRWCILYFLIKNKK